MKKSRKHLNFSRAIKWPNMNIIKINDTLNVSPVFGGTYPCELTYLYFKFQYQKITKFILMNFLVFLSRYFFLFNFFNFNKKNF
jgi:hypothetical protein